MRAARAAELEFGRPFGIGGDNIPRTTMKIITIARHLETSKPGRPACQPGSGLEPGQICAAVRTKREEMTNYSNLFAGNCGYLRVFARICGFGEFFAPHEVLCGWEGVAFGNLESIAVDLAYQNSSVNGRSALVRVCPH
jgi:hypothetical protein